jgi:hypothetical protein
VIDLDDVVEQGFAVLAQHPDAPKVIVDPRRHC